MRWPLTSIERYHWLDDRPSHPNHIGCRLVFDGRLDRAAWEAAMRLVAARHPLIASTLIKRGRRLAWQPYQPGDPIRLEWNELDDAAPFPEPVFRYLNLTSEPAYRVVVAQGQRTTRVWIELHHAVTDGIGGAQCLDDLLTAYTALLDNPQAAPGWRKLDPASLARRNRLGLASRQFLRWLPMQPIAALGATKFLARRVAPIEPAVPDDQPPQSDSTILSAWVPEETVASLYDRALKSQATVNDLLLAHFFVALDEWMAARGNGRPDDWLRLMIPINIRTMRDRRMPAANRATIVQLDRRRDGLSDFSDLVWGIHYELGNILRWNLDRTFLIIMRTLGAVPGQMARIVKRPACRATAVVSNLGAALERSKLPISGNDRRVGNLVLREFDLVLPLRPLTQVAIAVAQWAGRLRLTMHYDRRAMDHAGAAALLAEWTARLTR